MELNANFKQRVLIHADQMPWVDSPMAGVQRRMLDRIGDEVARATSIVRYAPDSHFSPHVHTGGEEFIVLDGVFQDEHGDFPTGSYVRNPPQSSHTPGSEPGCIIFVKLWQFEPSDRTHVVIDMNKHGAVHEAFRAGVTSAPLFKDDREEVRVEVWAPAAEISLDTSGGAELLVLEGSAEESGDQLARWSWLRIPIGGEFQATAGPEGARVWIKTGGLRFVQPPTQP